MRANLPGAPFHLIARLQDGKPLFAEAEAEVYSRIERSVRESRVRLLAYAIMSNHLHLVVVQGRDPLSHLMQPLLRRLALLAQRLHGGQGHVFQGRYRAYACLDARRLRAALAYVHLNPVRASICDDPMEYEWTSHRAFCGRVVPGNPDGVEIGLRLYARDPGDSIDDCRDSYKQFIAWRLQVDALQLNEERTVGDWLVRPTADGGDDVWWDEFATAASGYSPPQRAPDLEVIARSVLTSAYAGSTLDWLRSGGRCPAVTDARRLVIERAIPQGYANYQIARYLRISPTVVSRVACAFRAKVGADSDNGHQHG